MDKIHKLFWSWHFSICNAHQYGQKPGDDHRRRMERIGLGI